MTECERYEYGRYTNGYVVGLNSKVSYHPYMLYDYIWAMGYRDAQRVKAFWLGEKNA